MQKISKATPGRGGVVVAALLITMCCWGQSSKVEQKADSTKSPGTMKALGGCIYFSGGGNARVIPAANSCNQPMQFTITWAGGRPPHNMTYRINNWGSRDVIRQDIQGTIVSEEPAKRGLGGPAKVRVEDKDLGQGQHLLSLVNGESVHIFVYGDIHIRDHAGKEIQDCKPATVVNPIGRERACVYFAGQTYVDVLQADKDPD